MSEAVMSKAITSISYANATSAPQYKSLQPQTALTSQHVSKSLYALAGVLAICGNAYADGLGRSIVEDVNSTVYTNQNQDRRKVAYAINFVPRASPASCLQLAEFFRAMPNADRLAVRGIFEDIDRFFSDALISLEIEHNYDLDARKHQLFISVETGLKSQEIVDRRKAFDQALISDDAKNTASRYTFPIFF
nr:hypothetical protein [Delftia acidovorans]